MPQTFNSYYHPLIMSTKLYNLPQTTNSLLSPTNNGVARSNCLLPSATNDGLLKFWYYAPTIMDETPQTSNSLLSSTRMLGATIGNQWGNFKNLLPIMSTTSQLWATNDGTSKFKDYPPPIMNRTPHNMLQTSNSVISSTNWGVSLLGATKGNHWWAFKVLELSCICNKYYILKYAPDFKFPIFATDGIVARVNQ